MPPLLRPALLVGLFAVSRLAAAAGPEASAPADESVFFGELPVVLSVSRLAQPLAEAPGAVTVIDAEAIRASGARDLADLLRAVPGFLVAQSPGGAPIAVYHGLTDENPRGLQILVDGRSQYSPLFYGGVSWNLIDVSLDDIERIEVVRGSNSAAYGSNAFLGVVNVVTRPAAVTQGAGVRVDQGGDGVEDRYARLGLRLGEGFARLSAEQSHDNGVRNVNDSRRNGRVNLQADMPVGLADEFQFQAGMVELALDAGQTGNSRDLPRVIDAGKDFVSVAWKHQAGSGGGTSLRYTRSRERYSDVFTASDPALDALAARLGLQSPYPVPIDQKIHTTREELEFQDTALPARDTRLLWGAGARYDRVQGEQLYSTRATLQQKVHRLFGNLEWRPLPWVFNLGGTWENDSLSGTSLSPRLSANYQLTPEQTLRAGITRAHRIPTLTESRARSAYGAFDTALLGLGAGVVPVEITRRASGNLDPERIDVQEIGYLGNFQEAQLFVDLRGFRERVRDRIVPVGLPLAPPDCELLGLVARGCGKATDFINGQDLDIRGAEYQIRWRPRPATELTLNQTFMAIGARANAAFYARDGAAAAAAEGHMEHSAPRNATMLRWSERLPLDMEVSVAHYRYSRFQWTVDSSVGPFHRTDLRLAYPLRLGNTNGQLALVAQGVGSRHAEYRDASLGAATAAPTWLGSRAWISLLLGL